MMQEIDEHLESTGAVLHPVCTQRSSSESALRSVRVALVEDDECLADLLLYNLQAVGYTVEWIADGRDALARFEEVRPDVVVLDWMLPHLSGIEVLRRMKLDANLSDVPVLMLTGRTSEGDRRRALLAGAAGFITKPFSVDALVRRISELSPRQGRED